MKCRSFPIQLDEHCFGPMTFDFLLIDFSAIDTSKLKGLSHYKAFISMAAKKPSLKNHSCRVKTTSDYKAYEADASISIIF